MFGSAVINRRGNIIIINNLFIYLLFLLKANKKHQVLVAEFGANSDVLYLKGVIEMCNGNSEKAKGHFKSGMQ